MSGAVEESEQGPLPFTDGGQLRRMEQSLEQVGDEDERVECLGTTFPNDGARRTHFLEKLREKLDDPEFRNIEGFPIGEDEAILAMSDPPYYTACPNPFLEEFVRRHAPTHIEQEAYHREPFAVDVSEGKTDPIYAAHAYHTKVPHKAIIPAILHYTEPGDLVLDGFAGSGMTGVAAQMCGDPDPEFRRRVDAEWRALGRRAPRWGARRVVLNDLSPAATFIAANYNLPFEVEVFELEARKLLDAVEVELGWMYETHHTDGRPARIDYTVWSEVFACPECAAEVVFVTEALDRGTRQVRETFPCPHCAVTLNKERLQRVFETLVDPGTGGVWNRILLRPVLIQYRIDGHRHEKQPDRQDLQVVLRIAALPLPAEVPAHRFQIEKMDHGSRIAPKGFTHSHHFFLPRTAQALGSLWRRARACPDQRMRNELLFFVEQAVWTGSILNRYRPTGYSQVNQYLTGVYYVPSQHAECSPWYILKGKLDRLVQAYRTPRVYGGMAAVSTGTAARSGLPDGSIDYIFTDPPFGANMGYADLNLLVEAWHRVRTDADPEAIVDRPKGKGLPEYQHLMQRCFSEYYRVLKPGRWMVTSRKAVGGGARGRWRRRRPAREGSPGSAARPPSCGHMTA